jgi:hypothetical protein
MKIKYLLSVMAIVAITKNSFAQYSQDALRFSQTQTGSTARIKAIGNAGTAVGGDLSSVSGNPAGLGFFSKSEMSITPEFNGSKINSTYFGSANSASTSNGNLNNAAAVFFYRVDKPRGEDKTKGLLSINFGIAYNRVSDYYGNTSYSGTNTSSSIVDYFNTLANNDGSNPPSGGSLQGNAFNGYLIDSVGYNSKTGKTLYRSNVIAGNTNPISQLSNTYRTGGQSALNLAFGTNFGNRFYMGLGIGITTLRYNVDATYIESGYQYIDKLNYNAQYTQSQVTKGTGFNGTLGFIFKPVDAVRIGATITSPTYYTIDDSYSEGLTTKYSGSSTYTSSPSSYPLTYNLRTPLKVSGGLAIFAGKLGFVSADIEYLDYSSIHIDDSGYYSASSDNTSIQKNYQSTVNVHAGAEARVTPNFFLRGGYGVQGNPWKDNNTATTSGTNIITNVGSATKTISGGVGYRAGNYYFDATYTNVTGNQYVYPYEIGTTSPTAYLDKTTNNVFLTVGLRF